MDNAITIFFVLIFFLFLCIVSEAITLRKVIKRIDEYEKYCVKMAIANAYKDLPAFVKPPVSAKYAAGGPEDRL